MDQQRYSSLPRPSTLHPPAASLENSKASEPLQPTLLSLCTGLEEPPLGHTKSEDTDITTKTGPAVTHERVQPLQHTRLEHRITREVHTHDVYHRVLPIIDTEILPTRHFIDNGVNVWEVSAEDVWKHTVTGHSQDVKLNELRRPPHGKDTLSEPKYPDLNHQAEKQEAILADKKTYITDEGYPRTEYLWLHPPVFEDQNGQTRPVLIPAGLSPEWRAIFMRKHGQLEQVSSGSMEMGKEEAVPIVKRRRSQDLGQRHFESIC